MSFGSKIFFIARSGSEGRRLKKMKNAEKLEKCDFLNKNGLKNVIKMREVQEGQV